MNLRSRAISACLLLVIFLSGCLNSYSAVDKEKEQEFQSLVALQSLNEYFRLETKENVIDYRFGSEIPLKIVNISSRLIQFDPDSHVKLYMIRDNTWDEVGNVITYSGSLTLSPTGTILLDYALTRVQPDWNDEVQANDQKELVRIFMIGEIVENGAGTGEQVGAYLDVFVSR